MNNQNIKSSKQFLSQAPHEHSAIGWTVERDNIQSADDNNRLKYTIFGSVRIQDCTRSIDLDFDIYDRDLTEENIKNRFDKINCLIDELCEFRDVYTEAIDNAKQAKQAKQNRD